MSHEMCYDGKWICAGAFNMTEIKLILIGLESGIVGRRREPG